MNSTRLSWLDRFFKLSHYKTNVKTEILIGLTTFVTMAYIIVVQPDLMKAAGMDQGAVMVTVLLASGLFSIIMGLYAKRPFGVAPGMGGNVFFAYSIVAAGLATWQQGLGMVFISGVVFLLLTFLGLRETISRIIPKNIKHAIGAAVGLFIIGTGFANAGIIVQNKTGTLTLGSLHSPTVLLSLIGLVIIIGLMARKLKAAVFIGIIITSAIGIPMGITKLPHSFGDLFSLPPDPSSIIFQVDIPGALKLAFFPLMFTFFTGEFFSTMGTVLGVGAKANLLDKEGNLPDIKKPFIVDGIATVGGSLLGQTTITTYIESASGVEAAWTHGPHGRHDGGCVPARFVRYAAHPAHSQRGYGSGPDRHRLVHARHAEEHRYGRMGRIPSRLAHRHLCGTYVQLGERYRIRHFVLRRHQSIPGQIPRYPYRVMDFVHSAHLLPLAQIIWDKEIDSA